MNSNAHSSGILNLSFTSLRTFVLCTTGFNSSIKLWNTKNLDKPVYVIDVNTHWVWDVVFHQTYSRLLLTCSSSALARVIVFNKDEEDIFSRNTGQGEVVPNSKHVSLDYLEFDESVYAVDWSRSEQWVFGGVSYNGHVHINKIPDDVKYKLMID